MLSITSDHYPAKKVSKSTPFARAGVLIPVDRIASVDGSILQVQPVSAGIQRRTGEGAGLGPDVIAILVGDSTRIGSPGIRAAMDMSFLRKAPCAWVT